MIFTGANFPKFIPNDSAPLDLIEHPSDEEEKNITYEAPPAPAKLMLSRKLDLDPEFRAEYDAWLLARFGMLEVMA